MLSRSLKSIVPVFVMLVSVMVLGGCDRQSAGEAQPRAEPAADKKAPVGQLDRSEAGSPLPDITVKDQAGATLTLASLKGQPVLINLWATWCAPCVVELPMLDEMAAEMDGVMRIVTVSQDMAQTEKVADFLKERGGKRLEPWLDPGSDLAFELGTQTLPATILYDSNGKEVWRYLGGRDWTSAESAELVSEALSAR